MVNKFLSKLVINKNISSKPNRPFPLASYSHKKRIKGFKKNGRIVDVNNYHKWHVSKYTSWEGLTNKTFSGRLLPPMSRKEVAELPPIQEVANALIRKGKPMEYCHKSSILFMGFAQWFTDAFLRIDAKDIRKNTSNHEIDLCQIYGLNKKTTDALRSKKNGKLKSQIIENKEFPQYLFGANLKVKKKFKNIEYTKYIEDDYKEYFKDPEKKKQFFATGLGRGNSTVSHIAINILFLRLHNKVASLIKEKEGITNDERLFQTTRNILIVLLIKVTIEDYVNHLKPLKWMKFVFDTSYAEKQKWYRNNWISSEFDIAYRWHSLIPDHFSLNGKVLETKKDFRYNNEVVLKNDLSSVFNQLSYQKAGKITLANSPDFMYGAEISGLYNSRALRIASFKTYKEQFKGKKIKNINDITNDKQKQDILKSIYGENIDSIEFFVGLLAEDAPINKNWFKKQLYEDAPILGETMLDLVASDAFSHALTNPLLSKNIFTKKDTPVKIQTFTSTGLSVIESINSLKLIVDFVEETDSNVSFNYNKVDRRL